jgi:hypothetical protein
LRFFGYSRDLAAFNPSVFIVLIVFNLVLIPKSIHPSEAVEKWSFSFLVLIGALLIIDSLGNGWSPKTWLDATIIIALVFSLIEITLASFWYAQAVELTGLSLNTLPFGYRSSGLLIGHANVFSGLLNFIIIIMCSRFLTSSSLRTIPHIISRGMA